MFDQLTGYLGIAASVVGALTAALTVYAKVRDLRKKWAEARAAPPPELPLARRLPPQAADPTVELVPDDEDDLPPRRPAPHPDRQAGADARRAVRMPAVALMATAAAVLAICVIGLCALTVAPLADSDGKPIPKGTAALVYVMFALPNLVALSAGWGMLHLRGYNMALAGSLAVMPAFCVCAVAGVPVGAWCLLTLRRTDVQEAFH